MCIRDRFQSVVDPAAEQRRFHRPAPGLGAFPCPSAQDRALGRQLALLEDGSVGGFHAVADAFLVDVESDIVVYVHTVLLFEVSEPAVMSRSWHCTLQENPPSSESLYIQTGYVTPKLRSAHRFAFGGFVACPRNKKRGPVSRPPS